MLQRGWSPQYRVLGMLAAALEWRESAKAYAEDGSDDKASWRDHPKLLLQLHAVLQEGTAWMLCSGLGWKVTDGPVRFDGLRNGLTYDARKERPGWSASGYDDSGWAEVQVVPGPGGVLEPQQAPPCKVVETLVPVSVRQVRPGVTLYDLGQNIAGWAQLRVRGAAGTQVTLRYAEKLTGDGELDPSNIDSFIRGGDCQTDRYTLKGEGEEVWEPRFTYHGFQYLEVSGLPAEPAVDNIRGRVVQTAFRQIGSFKSSSAVLNRLQVCALWAYRGNFVGIPTDCPHREKNGWTGDAQLATETGLMNFQTAPAYREWLQTLADTQRPSGQLPGIAPSTGWGYNWGSGPAWDSAMLLLPWYIYLYTGDLAAVEEHYQAMQRYVEFCGRMATGHIVSFGLGDWCHVDRDRIAPPALTSTGYYYRDARLMAALAELTGRSEDARSYAALAEQIREAFHQQFYKGDGVYAGGEQTALACAVYQELVPDAEKEAVVVRLAESVEQNGARADFGILGAKYVPQVLAANGHMELAYRVITQPDFPGWVHWLEQGATRLWENWNGSGSRNHIMFGDISAWMYEFLAGIRPDLKAPGFERVALQPRPVTDLDWVRASHQSPCGAVESFWQRQDDGVRFEFMVPAGAQARIILPAGDPGDVRVEAAPEPAAVTPIGTPESVTIEIGPGTNRLLVRP